MRIGARVQCMTPRGHGVALLRLERDGLAVLEVDEQPPLEHEEELVLVVVLVPVEVALDDRRGARRRR